MLRLSMCGRRAACMLMLLAGCANSAFAQPASITPAPVESDDDQHSKVTPLSIPGSEPLVYRTITAGNAAAGTQLRLHVVKPGGWSRHDRRAALVAFFGGGWRNGSPKISMHWAKWATEKGMLGVAPDYRTLERFAGTPEDCISDARAAVRWVQAHADELGIDPKKIAILGISAGGHVAAWTALPQRGPGSDDPGSPDPLPAALVLINPVTDTTGNGYGGPGQFGNSAARALAASVPQNMPRSMPPVIVFHATGDTTVKYANSADFCDALQRAGTVCDLITFQGLGHTYYGAQFGSAGNAALERTREETGRFLQRLGLLDKR